MQDLMEEDPFFIIYNAREKKSDTSERLPKSPPKNKKRISKSSKPRKMTMNTESFPSQQMNNLQLPKEISLWNCPMEERDLNQSSLNWGNLQTEVKVVSSQEMELQKEIRFGLGNQSDLDDEFKWKWRETEISWIAPDELS